MFNNLDSMSKVFEKFQEDLKKNEEDLKNKIYSSKSGGGMVEVSVNGKGELIDLNIDDTLLEDKESLQILLISAINDAYKNVKIAKNNLNSDLFASMGNIFGMKK